MIVAMPGSLASTLALALGALALARHAATRRENLARHPLRSAILAALDEAPGLPLCELRRRVGCSAGTIQHHLRHLERGGLVAGLSLNHRRWIFPAGLPPDTCVGLAVLGSGRARELALSLVREPGQRRSDLARGLRAGRRVVREQVERLVRNGLATGVLRGRSTRYHPTERLPRLLAVQGFGPAPAAQVEPGPMRDVEVAPLVVQRLVPSQ